MEKEKAVVTEANVKEKALIETRRAEMKLIGLEKEKQAILLAVENNFPALLIGETGLGKTYILSHVAKELGHKIVRISLNGEVGINELLGKFLIKGGATYWQDGVLVDCMRKGYWVILDEINAALPEVLFCLNSLLDDARSLVLAEKDGEVVLPHKNFRVFATMNPCDEYAGTKEMNKALLSRFPIVLYFDNYEPDTELEIVKYQSGIEDAIARVMIDVANELRSMKQKKELYVTVSTRDVVNWARVLGCNGNTIAEAFEFAILNKSSYEEREAIIKAAVKAVKVDMKWNWKKAEFRKLTADLAVEVEKLQERRKNLLSLIEETEKKLNNVKEEVKK